MENLQGQARQGQARQGPEHLHIAGIAFPAVLLFVQVRVPLVREPSQRTLDAKAMVLEVRPSPTWLRARDSRGALPIYSYVPNCRHPEASAQLGCEGPHEDGAFFASNGA